MTTTRLRVLALAVVVAGCLAACGAEPAPSTSAPAGTTAARSPEPAAAVTQAAAEAAADPAAAGNADQGALATALRAADLPGGWSVQANPVPDGDLSDDPSLAGICGGTFTSEAHRTVKYPVVGLDAAGTPAVTGEAIAYDAPETAALALRELAAAFAGCPPEEYSFVPGISRAGLTADALALQYRLTNGVGQVVVAQVRGSLLSVLIGEDPATTLAAARHIADRLALVPAAAIGA